MTDTLDATADAAAVAAPLVPPVARLMSPDPGTGPLAPGRFIALPGGFRLWSQGALRSAGFPITDLVQLADPAYTAAVDRWLDEPSVHTRQALDAEAARAAARQAELLARIARRDDFQEAVTWQNPDVVEPMIVTLGEMAADAPDNRRRRKRQRIVAKYWARYCAKNETIGFFGPVSWFDFRSDGEPLRMEPGPTLVRRGQLYLEPWAVDALAARLSLDPEVRPWIAPRRNPMVYVEDTRVRTLGGPVELDADEARLLALVDGRRTARDIAAGYGGPPAEVYERLDGLADRKLLLWDLEPPLVQRAERVLRRRLEAIADADVRDRAIERLDRLEAAREALAGYRDPGELRGAYQHLEQEFTALTGVDPARRPGQAYGGRRLAYVECVRDVSLSFGPQVLESCADALSLLLVSARWFAHEAAQRLRAVLSAAFDAMDVESVGLNEIVFACADKIFIPGNRPLDHLIQEFAATWRAMLGLDTDARVVTLTSDALRGPVEEHFGGAHPSWGFAFAHSIDLLIAARGAEAFARGQFQPVIGEIHIAYCPYETPVFGWGHPDPAELRAMLATVIPDSRVMLSPVKDYAPVVARTYPWLNDARDWRLCASEYPPRGSDRQLPMCGLRVFRERERLVVGLPGRPERFDIADIHGARMMYDITDAFKHVLRGRAHTPRVVVDNLVVFREAWSFPIAELDWVAARSDAEHFVAVRRWLRGRGLPDTVFASISTEKKPVFVDFRSEVQVGNLAQLLRAGAGTGDAWVTFSEMLPAPEQSWLADADGNRYTAELRLVFADSSVPSSSPSM